jgi:hypothetical protein
LLALTNRSPKNPIEDLDKGKNKICLQDVFSFDGPQAS